MNFILRRRGVGKESCEQIAAATAKEFSVIRADELVRPRKRKPAIGEWVFRWGTTTPLPTGVKIVNSGRAISWASDKRGSRIAMQDAGIPVPESLAFTAAECAAYRAPGGRRAALTRANMYVGRKPTHAQGEFLASGSFADCMRQLAEWGEGGYVAKFIDKVEEYRVFVMQGRVVWVARKTPGNPEDIAWNISQGGHFSNVPWKQWPIRVIEHSVKAMELSGLTFGAVDAMVDSKGGVFILEINSAPLHSSEYRQHAVAKAFDWVVDNDTAETIAPNGRWKGYSKWIHPCMYDRAE